MTRILIPTVGFPVSSFMYDKQVQEWIKAGVIELSKGAVSYPRDFGIGAHFVIALLGGLGPTQRVKATVELRLVWQVLNELYGSRDELVKAVSVLFSFITKDQETLCDGVNEVLNAMKSDKAKFKYYKKAMRFSGRMIGGQLTKFVVTGGPYGAAARAHPAAKVGLFLAMTGVTTLGSIVRFIRKNRRLPKQIEAISAILLGQSTGLGNDSVKTFDKDEFSDLIIAIRSCQTLGSSDVLKSMVSENVKQGRLSAQELRCLR